MSIKNASRYINIFILLDAEITFSIKYIAIRQIIIGELLGAFSPSLLNQLVYAAFNANGKSTIIVYAISGVVTVRNCNFENP